MTNARTFLITLKNILQLGGGGGRFSGLVGGKIIYGRLGGGDLGGFLADLVYTPILISRKSGG